MAKKIFAKPNEQHTLETHGGGWIRIGIVLSILWAIGGGFWGNTMALNDAGKLTNLQLDNCVAKNRNQVGRRATIQSPMTKFGHRVGPSLKQIS
jgi:hypothetical protein